MLESTSPALDVTGCSTSALGHAGTQGCYTGACSGVTVPSLALRCADIHGPNTGTYWIPQPQHWDILGCMAFILELSRALVSGTETYWMHGSCAGIHWGSWSSYWSSSRLQLLALGYPGTLVLSPGTYWDLYIQYLGPAVFPALGPPALADPLWDSRAATSRGQSPFMCESGCLQSTASPMASAPR